MGALNQSDVARRHFIVPGGQINHTLLSLEFAHAQEADDLLKLVDAGQVAGLIVVDPNHDHPPEWTKVLSRAIQDGVPIYHPQQFEEKLSRVAPAEGLAEPKVLPKRSYLAVKRTLDILLALLLAPIVAIAIALLALCIKLETRGPVFYRQERVGYHGDKFRIVKLRTMHVRVAPANHLERREAAKTKRNDVRVTGIGKFLRLSRLDELPQIWNVLTGEMSWVGPRPEASELAEWHEREIPFYNYRHSVRPGVTGWSQVRLGHVTDIESVRFRLELERFYIENMSLWLDAKIALRTIEVVLTGRGAK